jgi:hypothetical protein
MDGENLGDSMGSKIRQFFRDLFGSRLVESLELQLLLLRQDMERRLADQNITIASLREDRASLEAKVLRYEITIMPLSSRAGAELVKTVRPAKPTFPDFDFNSLPPVQSRWQQVQDEHDKAMLAEIEAEKSQVASAPQGTM